MRQVLLRLLPLVCLLILPASGLWAAPAGLTVVAGAGTVLDGAASAHYDFGVRRESDDSPLVHVFVLRNDTPAPLQIDRLQSSCGCTTAAVGEAEALPLTVAPGGTVPIRIQISPRRLLPGDTHKSVWVYTHNAVDATTYLEMRGMVQEVTVPSAPAVPIAPVTPAATAPQIGFAAPSFASTDTAGRSFTLAGRQGHPVALYFFCGCPWCADVARHWGRVQRAGGLSRGTQTVIVFAGGKAAAQAFAAANKLDMNHTTLLPDPEDRVTEGLYQVRDCPRVFALNAAGLISYTNSHPDDQPRLAPAQLLVSRVQASLRPFRK